MRNAILAMTMALTLVAGQVRAATHKTHPADVGPGRIAWFDITTTNLPQSKEFYGKLFDWKFTPVKDTAPSRAVCDQVRNRLVPESPDRRPTGFLAFLFQIDPT